MDSVFWKITGTTHEYDIVSSCSVFSQRVKDWFHWNYSKNKEILAVSVNGSLYGS